MVCASEYSDEDGAKEGQGAEGHDDRGHPAVRDEHAVEGPEHGAQSDRHQHRHQRVDVVVERELLADEVGGEADDGAHREVDVAGEHHQGLADGEDREDRDARGDPVEQARREVVLDDEREADEHEHDEEDEDALAPRLRPQPHGDAPFVALPSAVAPASPVARDITAS